MVEVHSAALEESWGRLSMMDLAVMAADSGVERSGSTVVLKVMDASCRIDVGARSFDCTRGQPNNHIQILILHYLLGAGNAQLANKLVTYREFEGGALYYSAFKSRTIDRLVREFGASPELLRKAGAHIRAENVSMGSVGLKVDFFPKLPVTVAIWAGDEEVPASANMLFDSSGGKIMPTEDLSVLGGELVDRLVELSKG